MKFLKREWGTKRPQSSEESSYSRWRRAIFISLPSVIVLVVLAILIVRIALSPGEVEGRYRSGAHQAIKDNNLELADVYFSRLLDEDPLSQPRDALAHAKVLAALGKGAEAHSILDRLAPTDKAGYPPAHEIQALQIAAGLSESNDPMKLSKLHHHLTFCRNEVSVDVMKAWSVYYVAVGQPERALENFEKAANRDPPLLSTVAVMHGKLGNEHEKRRFAQKAVEYLRHKLDKNPLDHPTRIELARMLVLLDRDEMSESVLIEGAKLQHDKLILDKLAEFSCYRYQKSTKQGDDFATRLGHLNRALLYSPKYPPAYQHLLELVRASSGSAEDREAVKSMLMGTIAAGDGVALAHFTLSNLLALERDAERSQWHAEKAYELDSRLIIVANNLAYLLAHQEEPDLDRALKLAGDAVTARPDQPEFRETLGTVLMKRGDHEAAIVELERALPGIERKRIVHQKLAFLYDKVGEESIATMHAERASQQVGDRKGD